MPYASGFIPPQPPNRGDGRKPGLYDSLVPSIDVGVRNDQILKVTALKLTLKGLFWGWQ